MNDPSRFTNQTSKDTSLPSALVNDLGRQIGKAAALEDLANMGQEYSKVTPVDVVSLKTILSKSSQEKVSNTQLLGFHLTS